MSSASKTKDYDDDNAAINAHNLDMSSNQSPSTSTNHRPSTVPPLGRDISSECLLEAEGFGHGAVHNIENLNEYRKIKQVNK